MGCGPIAAGLITPSAPDFVLEDALACATARQEANPCDVPACFGEYLKATPADQVSLAAKSIVNSAENLCRIARQQNEEALKQAARAAAEQRSLEGARLCRAGAADCVVKNCYDQYFSEFGASGALRSTAQTEIDRAEALCRAASAPPPGVSDGTYNAKAARGCGAPPQFGIHVAIRAGSISWEHRFRGVSYRWSGSVDASGGVRASVAGSSEDFSAQGQYSDAAREITMHYPQCGAEAVVLSIIGRL